MSLKASSQRWRVKGFKYSNNAIHVNHCLGFRSDEVGEQIQVMWEVIDDDFHQSGKMEAETYA